MTSTMSADQLNSFLEKLDMLCAKLKEDDCPICDMKLTEDKISCANGHGICGSCKLVVNICPECSANYPGDTNGTAVNGQVAANNVNEDLDAGSNGRKKCANAVRGCQTCLPESEITDHEVTCTFRLYNCKICSVAMCMRKLKGHCERSHKLVVLKNSIFHVVQDCETEVGSKYYLIEVYNELFWFWRNNTVELVSIGLQFCGNADRSSEFKYALEVISKDQKCSMKFGGPVLFDTSELPSYSPTEDFVMIAKNSLSSGAKFKLSVSKV